VIPSWLGRRSGEEAVVKSEHAPSRKVWVVAGLGNPGVRYARHRHNAGYLVTDELARRMGARFRAHKSGRADVVEGHCDAPGDRVVLLRPRTYMNESGGPVSAVLKFYRVESTHLIVVHDELDIPFGALRAKFGGGDNGHNGLRSIRQSLGTGDFFRIRVGIGRPPGRQDPADFVLSNYAVGQGSELAVQVVDAADAVESLMGSGLAETQQRYH
jgi:peptidyl-tRNA hydrolase, PTH1 family